MSIWHIPLCWIGQHGPTTREFVESVAEGYDSRNTPCGGVYLVYRMPKSAYYQYRCNWCGNIIKNNAKESSA